MATPTTPKAPATTVKALSIAAKRESFYSGGQPIPFGFEPRVIVLSKLEPDQVKELRADPYLIVKDVDVEAEPEPETK